MKKFLLVFFVFLLPLTFADKCSYPVYLSEDCNFMASHPLADSSDLVKWTLINPDNSLIWDSIDDNGFNSDGNYFYLNSGSVLNKIGEWTLIVDFVDIDAGSGNSAKENFTVIKKEKIKYCAKNDPTCAKEVSETIEDSTEKSEYQYDKPPEKNVFLGVIPVNDTNIFIGVFIIIVLLLVVIWKA